jgi:hypothetical protein
MNKKRLISIVVYLFLGFNSYSQSLNKFAEDYVKSFAKDTLVNNLTKHNICKIEADFNSDGILDLAFSDTYLCGAHACDWEIYLGLENESYSFFSTLWFSNYAIKIDSISKGVSKIYVYDKAGGGIGDIIEYKLSLSEGIKEISSRIIYPNTSPENDDYKYYKEIFYKSVLIDSCVNISDYLKTKKIHWKKAY